MLLYKSVKKLLITTTFPRFNVSRSKSFKGNIYKNGRCSCAHIA